MANTTVISRRAGTIIITGLDSNWNLDDDTPFDPFIKVHSIQFNPSGADICVVRTNSLTGCVIFDVKCTADTDQRIKYYHEKRCTPYIAIANLTLDTAANAAIIIEFLN